MKTLIALLSGRVGQWPAFRIPMPFFRLPALRGRSLASCKHAFALVLAGTFLAAPLAHAVQLASPAPNQSAKSLSPTGAVSPVTTPRAREDIRGLRPPYHIATPWLWTVYAAGALAVLALGFGGWRWLRRVSAVPELTLRETTLRKLEETRVLMRPERARDFSIAVSEIVRDYVQQRFEVSASQFTTWEFLHYLTARTDSPLAGYRPLLGEFLYHCDAAKFARWILSETEMEEMLKSACRFVQETGLETDNTRGSTRVMPGSGSVDESIEETHSGPVQSSETTPASSVARAAASGR